MGESDGAIAGTLKGGTPGLEPTLAGGFAPRIGPYELVEEIGRGGMGVVYRARRSDTGATFAIKLLSGHAFDDPKLRQRFLREARAAASITHPNILRVHGIFEEGTLLAIVMDYIPGATLRSRIKLRHGQDGEHRPVCDVGWMVRITRQVADGLAAAHRAGVIHRDIKPSNILLDPTGQHAWVADFGLAVFERGDDSLTSTGHQLGTPAYMSPEQARGERVDRRSDLFSLGCLAYAMVIGESPFHDPNLLAVIRRVSDHTPLPLDELGRGVPPALARIVARLMEKVPDARYDRAEDVVEALDQCAVELDLGPDWPPPAEWTTTEPMVSTQAEATEPSENAAANFGPLLTATIPDTVDATPVASTDRIPTVRDRPRRTTAATVGVAAVLIGLACLAVWQPWRPDDGRDDKSAPVGAGALGTTVGAPASGSAGRSLVSGRRRTVATDGTADFRTVQEAIGAAEPNDTIEVLDDGTYDGPVVLAEPYSLEGVRLISKTGATLRAVGKNGGCMAVLSVEGVRGVHIEGFKVVGDIYVHSIMLQGNVTGTTLKNLRIVQPADAQWANILLARTCRATAKEPIQIRDCQFESGKYGIFSGRDDVIQSLELTQFLLERNRFSGPATHLHMRHSASDIRIERNLFLGGRGIDIDFQSPRRSGPISIINNTFDNTNGWIKFGSDRGDYAGVAENNLIIDAEKREEPREDPFGPRRRELWRIDHNVLESPAAKGETVVEGFGMTTADAGLVSRDPASADFLRPKPGGIAATAGAGKTQPTYVGARQP